MLRHIQVPRRGKPGGFSLIEVLTVVVIVGILASVGYPAYQDSVRKARRNNAKAEIMDAAQQLERCFTQSTDYRLVPPCPTQATIQGQLPNGFYTIALAVTTTTYTITASATSVGNQDKDAQCVTLDLDQAGAHTATTSTTCW